MRRKDPVNLFMSGSLLNFIYKWPGAFYLLPNQSMILYLCLCSSYYQTFFYSSNCHSE